MVAGRVQQNSVLGFLERHVKWRACFPVTEEAPIIDFVVDLAVLVTAKHPEDVEVYATETVRVVMSWVERARLTLVAEKTKVVLIMDRRK